MEKSRPSMSRFSRNTLLQMHGADDYYVYALIDPRDYKIFYIGKGRGNRVFQHAKQAKYDKKEDDECSAKISLIKAIQAENKEVICQICRWGLDENTAYEIEATLIDMLPGLTNDQSGHAKERGLINAEDLEAKLNIPTYKEPEEDYIIIKTTPEVVSSRGNLYDATRIAWRASLKKAKKYKYVLSVIYGIVQEVYEVTSWYTSKTEAPRVEFEGKPCDNPNLIALKGKMIPDDYRSKGAAYPFMYKKQ